MTPPFNYFFKPTESFARHVIVEIIVIDGNYNNKKKRHQNFYVISKFLRSLPFSRVMIHENDVVVTASTKLQQQFSRLFSFLLSRAIFSPFHFTTL